MAINYNDEFHTLTSKYDAHDYGGVIKEAGGVIESALKDLYETYFTKFPPTKQKNIIIFLEDKYKGSSFKKLGLGQMYGFFTAQKIWTNIAESEGVHPDNFKLLALDKLSYLVTLRNDTVHNEHVAEESEAMFALSYVRSFLQSFVIFEFSGEKKGPRLKSSLDSLLATEVLLGEVQLYESLNEVLEEESIDSVDVTYFSDVIPGNVKQNEVIGKYWSRIANMVNDNSIMLRRVVSLPSGSGKIRQQKTLWVLLAQFSKYCNKINEGQVGLSMIEASKLKVGNEMIDQMEVPLINLILLYSKRNPAVGHAWLFGSHNKQGGNQVYLHMAGKGGFMALRSMYDNLYASGLRLTTKVARELMDEATGGLEVSSDKFQKTIKEKSADFGLTEQEAHDAIEFWASFVQEGKGDESDYF